MPAEPVGPCGEQRRSGEFSPAEPVGPLPRGYQSENSVRRSRWGASGEQWCLTPDRPASYSAGVAQNLVIS